VASDVLVGIGWDNEPQAGEEPAIRWLGESFNPSAVGSSLVHRDLELVPIILTNRIARLGLNIEKEVGQPIWAFAQPHIKTVADAAKLSRYMNRYPAIH
jgi:hypothetical protein